LYLLFIYFKLNLSIKGGVFKLSQLDTYTMNDGRHIPVFGFGTAELEGEEATQSTVDALEMGYRLVDTSPNYGNEVEVGKGIQSALEKGLSRENLFLTTKVESEDMSQDGVMKSVDESLNRLNLDYIDLLLIHTPDEDEEVNVNTWKGMEAAVHSGKVKSIGVSNFKPKDLSPVLKSATIKPVINQVEYAPGDVDWDTKDYCEKESIIIMAYSPLKKGKINDSVITDLADKYNKSPQQIALRWAIDCHTIPIPRSGNKEHIKDNIAVFDYSLTAEEVETINQLD